MTNSENPILSGLYIDLFEAPSHESREVSKDVVLDYDKAGKLVGIDIDQASKNLELTELIVSKVPTDMTMRS